MNAPEHVLRNRPNKLAKGITRTLYRSAHRLDGVALTLSVRGTTDALQNALAFQIERHPARLCECCGQKMPGKFRLNARGREHLRIIKQYRRPKLSIPFFERN